MGLRSLEIFYSFRAEIDFGRQNLNLTSKVGPRTERVIVHGICESIVGFIIKV